MDQNLLAIGSENGEIRVIDLPHEQEIMGVSYSNPALSLAISADGRTLASSHCLGITDENDFELCDRNEIRLWDVTSGELLGLPLQGHSDFILALAFNENQSLLASGSQDKTILLWDVESREPLGVPMQGHKASITSLVFSPDDQLLASGSLDNHLILWDVGTYQTIGSPFTGSLGSINSLVFNPDGKTLYSGNSDGRILAWDVGIEFWIARVCQLAGRNLTNAEWNQFLPISRDYEHTCPGIR